MFLFQNYFPIAITITIIFNLYHNKLIIMKMRPSYFAFKIKDGVFIGDGNSPNQLDFLFANKITTIINCAGSQILINHNVGIRIINFQWLDNDQQVILDQTDSNFQSIYYFIQDTHNKFESVLICSLRGQSRSLTIITAYLIKKYKWSLYKTLEYMNSKRNDFQIRANFLKQLVAFEIRLFGKKLKNCTKNWEEKQIEMEGEIVKNTYMNSLRNKNNSQLKFSKKKLKNGTKSVKFSDNSIFIPDKIATQQQQQDLTIIQLNKVIQRKQNKQDNTPKRIRRLKCKSEQCQQLQQVQIGFREPILRLSGNKQRRVVTPYRIRKNSNNEKIEKIKTEPKEDLQFNINLNINEINIISGIQKGKEKFLKNNQFKNNFIVDKRRLSKRSSVIFNEDKLKMQLGSNNIQKRSLKKKRDSFMQPRSNSSISKRLSFDHEDKKKPNRDLKQLYYKKQIYK